MDSVPSSDLTPASEELKEEVTSEQNATETEVTIPNSCDVPETLESSFEDKSSRIGFIQKVLAIKLLQSLAVTLVLIISLLECYPLRWAMHNDQTRLLFIVLPPLALVVTLVLLHCCNFARFRPFHYLLLAAYPLSFAVFTSTMALTIQFDLQWLRYNVYWRLFEICLAWVHLNVILFALFMYSIFTLQTKIEFNPIIAFLTSASLVVASYALLLSVSTLEFITVFGVLICPLMIFLLTAYILLDIHAMTSKTYRIRLSPSDFVKAALIMHIDYRYMMIMQLYKKTETPVLNDDVDSPKMPHENDLETSQNDLTLADCWSRFCSIWKKRGIMTV